MQLKKKYFSKRKLSRILNTKKENKIKNFFVNVKNKIERLFIFYKLRAFLISIRDNINTTNFGTVFIIFLIVMFLGLFIINQIRFQSTYIESETIDKIISKWSLKHIAVSWMTFMLAMEYIWLLAVVNRRPRKPQIIIKQ